VDRKVGLGRTLLLQAANAREIVQIGSSADVSTIWLAAAARDNGGRVTGTRILPERAGEAIRNLAAAGLAAVASTIVGDARETVLSLAGPINDESLDHGVDFTLKRRRASSPGAGGAKHWPKSYVAEWQREEVCRHLSASQLWL
jgi:hypothetical protein